MAGHRRLFVFALAASVSAVPGFAQDARPETARQGPFARSEATPAFARNRAAGFVENVGQWPAEVRFLRGGAAGAAWITEAGLVLDRRASAAETGGAARACAVEIAVENGAEAPAFAGEALQPGLRNYLFGADPADWHTGAQAYERVRVAGAWPGIDLVWRASRAGDGLLEYDLELAPGADLDAARLRVDGALGLALDGAGRLLLETSLGPLVQTAPVAWCVGPDGAQTPYPCRFRLLDDDTFGFEGPPVPAGSARVIDPGVKWGTYLGDVDMDLVTAVASAANGDAVYTGTTLSAMFPHTRGSYDLTNAGAYDAFVTRLTEDIGWLKFSTFLGGTGADRGEGLELLPNGDVWVGGSTASSDFPVTAGAHDTTHGGGWDGFAARLSDDGGLLLASTFLGGVADDFVRDLALDAQARPVLCGRTGSSAFPIVGGGYDSTFGGGVFGGGDAFVARLDANGATLLASTFLGGVANDGANRLAIDADGSVVAVGWTGSSNFPVTFNALDSTLSGSGTLQDAFVSRLSAGLDQLQWSTFFGGSAREDGLGVALAANGDVWLVGETQSSDLPLGPNPVQSQSTTLGDGFFARIDAGGSTVLAGSYLGGDDRDELRAVFATPSDGAIVVGGSASSDFPVSPWAYDKTQNSLAFSSSRDVVIVELDPAGQIEYASYLGGIEDERAFDACSDGSGGLLLCGETNSYNFPSWGGYDPYYDYSLLPDGFALRFTLERYPFLYGTPKINSNGSWAFVSYSGFPSASSGGFTLYGDGASANSIALFFWSSTPGLQPFAGGQIYLSPPFHRTPVQSVGWLGSSALQVPIDASMIGTRRYYQLWYADPNDPFGVGLSQGLEVLFYP